MNYKAGCLYRLTRDYATQHFVIQAKGCLFCVHHGERCLYMRAKQATEDGSFKSLDLTIPLGIADQVLEEVENPVILPFDTDPLTWYGKRVELIRDVPTLSGAILPAHTEGLEVLGSAGPDLLIGWRTSYKPAATGEFIDDAPVMELAHDPNPAAVARVPVSLFWILPIHEIEKVYHSPVGEEQ